VGDQASVTVQFWVEARTPLQVVDVTETPAPVVLVPVIVSDHGRRLRTVTVVDVDWPTSTDGNVVPAGKDILGVTMNPL
jgi:hypothetical protein